MSFLRYILTGGVATGVHYAVLVALVGILQVAPWAAGAMGAGCGALVGYSGNRRLTFRSRRRHASALPRFLLVAAASAALSAGVVWVGSVLLGWHYMAAQLAATGLAVLAGYRANRVWTFA